jgi:hypothetical protein
MVAPLALLGSFLPTGAVDVVGFYTQDFRQVFPKARPIKCVVKEEAQVMEHPLETGATITDHRIILPVELEVSVVVGSFDYRNTYQIIKQIFLNAELLSVQTKLATYENQLIAGIPHEEDPEMFDAIAIAIKLKEAKFVTPQSDVVPRNATQKSTVDRGNQQAANTSAANEEKSSVLFKVFGS